MGTGVTPPKYPPEILNLITKGRNLSFG
jgi:hypothetical protein